MIESQASLPVAKGIIASNPITAALIGSALVGAGAYYLYKRYGKKAKAAPEATSEKSASAA